MSCSPEELYRVIREVRPLYRNLIRAVDANLAHSGVTVAGRGLLEQLHRDGPQTVPQLARALLVPRQFVQKLANGGLEAGLLQQRPNPAHRRSPLLDLTDTGASEFEAIKQRELASLRGCSDIAPDDIATTLRVLQQLSQYFEGEKGAADDE